MKSEFSVLPDPTFSIVYSLEYWRGLASSTYFPGLKLETCLAAIHVDIIASWNFNDPDDVHSLSNDRLFL
jgi:hypothetical protein